MIASDSGWRVDARAATVVNRDGDHIAHHASRYGRYWNPTAGWYRLRYHQIDLIYPWISGRSLIKDIRLHAADINLQRRVNTVWRCGVGCIAVGGIGAQPRSPQHNGLARRA